MNARLLLVMALAVTACKPKNGRGTEPMSKPPEEQPVEVAPVEADPGAVPEEEAPPPPPPKVSTTERLQQAVALLTTGAEPDTLAARKLLEQLADEDDKNAYVHLNLGVTYQRLGDLERAASSLQRATRLDGDNTKGWLYLGLVEQSLGDPDAAMRRYRKGIDRNPEDLELRVALASAQRELGQPSDALETAKEALAINFQSLPLYDVMGQAYLDLGEVGLARFVYEKARTLPGGSENAGIQANLGRTLYELGERYQAETKLKEAVGLDADHVPALVQLSRIYIEDHNWAEAVPLLERARAQDPTNYGVWMNLGTAYRGMGRTDDARAAWETSLELDPSNPDPQFNLAILYGDDLKDYGTAVARFKSYIDAGGVEVELAEAHIEAVLKEKKSAERRKKREEDRKRREAEREAERKLVEEAERKAAEEAERQAAEEAAAPPEPAPQDAPTPDETPEPAPDTPDGETP